MSEGPPSGALPGMPATKPLVIVTRKLPDAIETRMRELFDTRLNLDDKPMSQADLIDAVQKAEVLVPTVTDRIDAKVLVRAGEKLKLIANFGTGVDNIDVKTALERGITVTNTPGVLTEDTADMTMALMLAVPRRLVEGVRVLEAEQFHGWSPSWMLGHRIWGKRLGILGMGRIGQAVARRAKAFGLQIHYHNRKPVHAEIERELEATYWDSLDQMLARMDIVSINCPHTPATYHLLSARRLKLMKPGAYIVNTARGEVIDENALARQIEEALDATYWESLDQMLNRMDIISINCPHTPATYHLLSARRLKLMKPTAIIVNTARGEVIDENAMVRMLKAGELAGAGLDVYEHEPQVNPKLLELESVVLLPHMGSATLEGRIEMGEKVLINIKTFADGHKPPDRVLATMF